MRKTETPGPRRLPNQSKKPRVDRIEQRRRALVEYIAELRTLLHRLSAKLH